MGTNDGGVGFPRRRLWRRAPTAATGGERLFARRRWRAALLAASAAAASLTCAALGSNAAAAALTCSTEGHPSSSHAGTPFLNTPPAPAPASPSSCRRRRSPRSARSPACGEADGHGQSGAAALRAQKPPPSSPPALDPPGRRRPPPPPPRGGEIPRRSALDSIEKIVEDFAMDLAINPFSSGTRLRLKAFLAIISRILGYKMSG